jgi:hypothetical protein
MKFAFAFAATISWMGCGIDTAVPGSEPGGDDGNGEHGGGTVGDPGSPNPDDPGDGTGPITEVSGRIKTNTTWMDTIHIVGNTSIDKGVTVTVLPGTTVDVGGGFSITVAGVLDIQGQKASKVVFRSASPDEFWQEIAVGAGGELKTSYLVQTGGGISLSNTAKATIVDSQFSHAGGDLLTMSGAASLDMSYSGIGLEVGLRDTTHCDMHVTGPVTLKVTHSNLSAASYGIMFYGGTNADFTYDNWFGNTYDVDVEAAHPVTGDFSYGYFARGVQIKPGMTATNLATSRVSDAGAR